MRTKNLLLSGICVLGLLTACTEDEALETNNQDGDTYAQIAINITGNSALTRTTENTGETDPGTDEEQKVSDITVVLANSSDIAQYIYTPKLQAELTTHKELRATKPFKVPAGSYKVYVLANYNTAKKGLSPIIQNATDMTAYLTISEASKLSTNENFLMVNATAPDAQSFNAQTSIENEFDDDGTAITDTKNKVVKVIVDIERVVGKVTFDQTTTSFDIKDGAGKIAGVTLNGVGIINLNKKMKLVKSKENATNKPTGLSDWAYPKDPNYDVELGSTTGVTNDVDITTWISNNFSQSTVIPTTGFAHTFYAPENTMTAAAQQNGQTTGVVYETTVTPEVYTKLDKDAVDPYSKKFKAVLDVTTRPTEITDAIFTTDDTENVTNFYTYNGFIFKNETAALLYKAIAENASAEASAIIAAYNTAKNGDKADILKYKEGKAYYTAWIKHNPNSTVANEQDKYGVVRNHWYILKVTKVNKLGYNKPTYEDPKDPDDPEEASIEVLATIKPWTIVKQDVEL